MSDVSPVPTSPASPAGELRREGQPPSDAAAEALRESEARFRGAFDNVTIGMAITNPDGRWARVNAALCRLLGYSEEELVGRSFASLTHPDDVAPNMSLLRRVHAGELDRYQMEKRFIHKRGHSVWIALDATVVRDAEGKPLYLVAQHQDVTERKFAEIARNAQVVPDAGVRTNAPGMVYQFAYRAGGGRAFITVSQGANSLFGVDPVDVLRDPQTIFDLIHPDDREGFYSSGVAARDAFVPWNWEGRVILASGEEKVINGASRPAREPDGSIVSDGLLMDVTERRAAAVRLEESEQRYRSLFEQHPDAVFSLDLGGRFTSVNPAAEEISGFTAAELLGRPFAPLLVDEHVSSAARHFEQACQGEARKYEVAILHRTGRRVELDVTNVPIVVRGEVIGVYGIAKDQTMRRLLEAQLRQAQKMEAVGQLAGGVAHDFNNILAAITGYAELLHADLPPDDVRRSDAEEILKGARRAAGLTRQLLAFSRKQVLQPVTLDINDVVADAAAMLGPLLGASLKLIIEPAGTPAPVLADRSQFEQVLMNLAVNARDAMPEGGTLTIAVGVPERPAGEPAVVTLSVTDTGSGMPPEVEAHAFEPFFTTKPVGEGSGLGLAMVHGIVEQSGGTIAIRTGLGTGTTFDITMPMAKSAPCAGAPDSGGPKVEAQGTVLVVEDEDGVRAIARRILERAGYVVHVARNGADALRVLGEAGPAVDVVVSDMAMPEMGGAELARIIGMRFPTIRVVLMSGYAEDEMIMQGQSASGASFVAKPFSTRALLDAVAAAPLASTAVTD